MPMKYSTPEDVSFLLPESTSPARQTLDFLRHIARLCQVGGRSGRVHSMKVN